MVKDKNLFEITERFIEHFCCLNDINIHQVDMVSTVKNLNESGFNFIQENLALRNDNQNKFVGGKNERPRCNR